MITKNLNACLEILQDEVDSTKNDAERIQSAYKSLVEIYMICMNIDRTWQPLFRKAIESIINDHTIRDHCKVYIKYLKILRNLNDYEALLKSTVQMLDIYPNEFIPLEMVCWVYVNTYHQKKFPFAVSLSGGKCLKFYFNE